MSYIGNSPVVQATRTVTELTATAGQTVFNANGGYTVGFLDVYLNGAQLQSADFTATDGTSVTLASACTANDAVRLVAWGSFNAANVPVGGIQATGTPSSSTFLRGDGSWQQLAVTPAAVSDQANTSTGAFSIPAGTTAQRPASPRPGDHRFNTTTNQTEVWSGIAWTGITSQAYTIDSVLVVAGGGAGGGNYGGGGGGGGFVTASNLTVTGGTTYSVVVGAGGAASNGSDSSAFTYTAIGGGGGGSWSPGNGSSGGSGGGASLAGTGGSGTSGQGYAGGNGTSSTLGGNEASAGGGGANGAGANCSPYYGGAGGAGKASTITGSSVTYAGGGGGCGNSSPGAGGAGGGGTGTLTNVSNGSGSGGSAGGANTGGGGGGSNKNGGSGVVIISYLGSQKGSGGTVTSVNGYTIHTFTSSGVFTA